MLDAMSPLDAAFLYAENGTSHMHIGSCAIFDGPAPDIAELSALINSKLHLVPRYRQVVRFVPGAISHPIWVDDPHFHLSYHVRHSSLPEPGDDSDLHHLMGRLMSWELDRHRPLWETWMVEGLSGNRWAMISKVHHCMVDGMAGTDLMTALLDREPSAGVQPAPPWTPQPAPTGAQLMGGALRHAASRSVGRLTAIGAAVASPRTGVAQARELVTAFKSVGSQLLASSTPVSIEGTLGPHRRWAVARSSLSEVAVIRAATGASVNDVVLAAITGAFRAVLLERHEPVEHIGLRTLVPVSMRRRDDHRPNNQVAPMIAELPIGLADPMARLEAVRDEMRDLKAAHQNQAGEALFALAELVPPAMLALGTRALMGLFHRAPQRFINTVTTNVPGPSFALYALGREMVDYLPFVPLGEGMRIGVAILSYNGRLSFGITGDYDSAPDVELMARTIEAELAELTELGRRASTRARRAAPRRRTS